MILLRSEGWGFESLRARPGQRPVPILGRAAYKPLCSPGRLAQVLIQKTPAFQGRTRTQVETSGIRAISATGTEAFHPWAIIDQVRETTRAFHLLDHDGRVRAILPKRALDSADLLPALRTFLRQAVAQQPAAATASTASGEFQP